jgi:alkylation response protein AidB-like acyl-CoA dehydrogenase
MTRTSIERSSVPTTPELVERAAVLRPLLEANAEETERLRRVAEANIRAVREAGLGRILTPTRFGGLETDFRTMLAVMAELGKGCGSTAWAMSLINICAWLTGLYPERAQAEVFGADPDEGWAAGSLAPNGAARRADGGYVVSGSWPWASGCLHARWGTVGMLVSNETGEVEDLGLALIPMEELTIEDTWFVAGMRGTGSNTLVGEDVFVPEHRFLSYPRAFQGEIGSEHGDEALYRSAFVPVTILILVGPQLGLASAALELVTEKASARGITHTHFEQQAQSTGFQMQLAEAAITIDSAYLHAFRAADDVDGAAAAGELLDLRARARVRMDSALAAQRCQDAVDLLVSAHGASSFADANRLQRIWRDVHVASRHAITGWAVNLEIYGKALLGVEPNITELI